MGSNAAARARACQVSERSFAAEACLLHLQCMQCHRSEVRVGMKSAGHGLGARTCSHSPMAHIDHTHWRRATQPQPQHQGVVGWFGWLGCWLLGLAGSVRSGWASLVVAQQLSSISSAWKRARSPSPPQTEYSVRFAGLVRGVPTTPAKRLVLSFSRFSKKKPTRVCPSWPPMNRVRTWGGGRWGQGPRRPTPQRSR